MCHPLASSAFFPWEELQHRDHQPQRVQQSMLPEWTVQRARFFEGAQSLWTRDMVDLTKA
jgi:hypothetical protein